jgi:Holliday junction DNA helicase RuvA
MFAFLEGSLFSAEADEVVLDVNGIGYQLAVPAHLSSHLPAIGEKVRLFTIVVIRETSQTLYGFHEPQERNLFKVLLGVSGVGPRTALALIGTLTPDQFQEAIQQHNVNAVCKVPGIGRKTAERLIIEVRDKLPALAQRDFATIVREKPSATSTLLRDAMSALTNLGYTQIASQQALKTIIEQQETEPDLPNLITAAIQQMS